MFLFSKVEFVQGSERSTWASEAEEEEGASVNACKNEQNVRLDVFQHLILTHAKMSTMFVFSRYIEVIDKGMIFNLHSNAIAVELMNKLAKLRRHASQVHFAKIHFG